MSAKQDEYPTAEWKRAYAFSEIAEALAVPTFDVLAAWSDGEGLSALYTDSRAELDSAVLQARFERDTSGILRVVGYKATEFTVGSLFR